MGTMLFRMDQPVELVREIVYNLPEELFQSDSTTFLDPAMGKGDYLVGIAGRLKEYGHSKENILSRLYGFECNEMYVQNCLHRTPLAGANITIKTYEEVLEWMPDMRFDVVIGNPPYQKDGAGRAEKLWPKFTYNAVIHYLVDGGYLAFVIPDSWMCGSGNVVKGSVGLYHDVFKKYTLHRCNTDLDRFFPMVGSSDYIGYVILQKVPNANTGTTFVNKAGAEITLNLADFDFLPRVLTAERIGINQKTISLPTTFATISFTAGDKGRKTGVDAPTLTHHHKTYIRGGNLQTVTWAYFDTVQNPVVVHRRKVVLPLSGAEKFMPYVDDVGVPHCMSSYVILLDDNDLASAAIQVFNSKLFKFLVQENRTSGFAQPYVLTRFPTIDLSSSWTDAELYAHFNLTQEEIDLIESTVK